MQVVDSYVASARVSEDQNTHTTHNAQATDKTKHDIDQLDLRRLVGKLGLSVHEHTDPNNKHVGELGLSVHKHTDPNITNMANKRPSRATTIGCSNTTAILYC